MKPAGAGTINYVADWIIDVLDDLVGQVDQNIVVETSIDPKLQSVAEAAIIDELAAKSVKFNVTQGALVAMTPHGAVRAMVGGRNYADSQFNRAVTAKRQPGSAFKPFVFLTAVESGLDARYDAPGCADQRQGLDAGELHPGIFRPGDADPGDGDVAQHGGGAARPRGRREERGAHRAPARHRLEAEANASIALGTSEVTLLELVGAYAPFANGGQSASPHVVNRIRTVEGKTLYRRPTELFGQVVDPRSSA